MEINNNNNLPEYIQGIPTAKNRSKERRSLRSDNKHIQYCVNKIEVKEKKPTVPSNSN